MNDTPGQPMTAELRTRMGRGFAWIQGGLILQLGLVIISPFIWRLVFALPGPAVWLSQSVSLVMLALDVLVLVLVFHGMRQLGRRSDMTTRSWRRMRLIHGAILVLILWSLLRFVDWSLRLVGASFLSMNPLRWEYVTIGQALVWFVILFNGILLAITANNQLGALRFSRPTVAACLGGSLAFWLANTSYEMYRSNIGSVGWAYIILYSFTAMHVLWLIWLAILLGLARRRVVRFMHCHACGYDLTSNVTGICPECGVVVEATTPLPAK